MEIPDGPNTPPSLSEANVSHTEGKTVEKAIKCHSVTCNPPCPTVWTKGLYL